MEAEMEKGCQNYELLQLIAYRVNLWLVWAIGHNVKMPDLPNHKFPPCGYRCFIFGLASLYEN